MPGAGELEAEGSAVEPDCKLERDEPLAEPLVTDVCVPDMVVRCSVALTLSQHETAAKVVTARPARIAAGRDVLAWARREKEKRQTDTQTAESAS